VTGEFTFAEAVEAGLAQAMAADERVVTFGEDVALLRRNLHVRFGPARVRDTPISESAFLGAGVSAALAGLRPVVEIMLVDFLGVALDGLLNHAAKYTAFSAGTWPVPLVVRAACGGGYGDAGQHEQVLWGLLAGIPGLAVVVPSTPADAAGLMVTAVETESPVVYLEHKLLSDYWLDYLGGASRPTVGFDVPVEGARGPVGLPIEGVPLGVAARRREGDDVTLVSVGVGVHRCLEAAEHLAAHGVSAEVIDLRCVSPLDEAAIVEGARATGRVVVVDEDYLRGGLSGEVAAIVAERAPGVGFARVAVEETIPYARHLEHAALPNRDRIVAAARRLLGAEDRRLRDGENPAP
jgi:pyruvate/2-oxoglutarate/acetoin dehydrogenase E1 component